MRKARIRAHIIVPSYQLRARIDQYGHPERYVLRVAELVYPTSKMPSILRVDDQPELLDAYCLILTDATQFDLGPYRLARFRDGTRLGRPQTV